MGGGDTVEYWGDFQRPAGRIPFICRTFPREFQSLAPAKLRD